MKKIFTLITFVTLCNLFVNAQIAISDGVTITENFSIGTVTTAALPAVWKVDTVSVVRTIGLYSNAATATWRRAGNNMSSGAANGVYNYGAGDATTATDRAVGWLSSGTATQSGNLYLMLNNNGALNITGFTINYDIEKYRYGSNNQGFTIQLYYSYDGITWSSAGSNFTTNFIPDADNSGFISAPGTTIPVSSDLNILVNTGSNIFFAWNYSTSTGTTTTSAQGLGIDNVSITATSVICGTPSTQACNINFTNLQAFSMNVNWNNGTGSRRLVKMNTVNSFTNPSDGTEYTANSTYSGTGEQIIYKGTGNSVSINGLTASTTYYFKVFEINCYGSSSMYDLIDTIGNPINQNSANLCSTSGIQASNITFSALAAHSMKASWINGDADYRIVVVRQGFPVSGTPVNGTTYNANSFFGLGSTISPNEYVVYKGTGNSVILYGIQPTTQYYFAVFEMCSPSGDGSESYLTPATTSNQTTTSNIPPTYMEIESILVDACARTWNYPHIHNIDYEEGPNEMVRFVTGSSPLNTADMNVDWPNNAWQGICQTAMTDQIVQRLNSTIPITSCGKLLEPPAGIIPPESNVLFLTSSDTLDTITYFDIEGNTFETLTDTLYVIFQCSNPNNRDGHFGNYSDSSQVRTLRISFSSPAGCSDTVRYDKALLINQNGGYGGSSTLTDGARVDFAWDGNATYINQGCRAPFVALEVSAISAVGNNSCQYQDIQLSASITGIFTSVSWSGGLGTFSSTNTVNTVYTPDSSETGIVSLTLTCVDECGNNVPSVININIFAQPVPIITPSPNDSICDGKSLTLTATDAVVSGATYNWSSGETTNAITFLPTTGTYTVTATSNGCVASKSIDIVVNPNPTVFLGNDTAICQGQSLILDAGSGFTYNWLPGNISTQTLNANSSDNYIVTITDVNGCIDIDTLSLIINNNPTPSIAGILSYCDGANTTLDAGTYSSYLWSNASITQTIVATAVENPITVTVTDANNCIGVSSTVNLTINYPTTSTTSITECESYLWTDGNNYTTTGNYSQTLVNALGCDSIANLDLTINYATTSTTSITDCDSYLWTDGNTYTTSGNYSQTLVGALGCDSIANLDLTINYTTTSTTSITECDSYLWTDGNTYTTSGNYSQTLVGALGCDSIANLNLTINYFSTSTTSITECDSYLWTDGNTYTTSGNYSQTLVNALGCDSIANLELTINVSTSSTTNVTACDSFIWTDGNTYTTSGNYSQTLVGAIGCDSIANLDLTINYASNSTTSITACDSYIWTDGNTYTTSGNFSQTLINALGCDSVSTLTLTINPIYNTPTSAEICFGDSIYLQNNYQKIAGTYYDTLTSVNGCDSVIATTLTVNVLPTPSITGSLTYCTGFNTTLSTSSTYSSYLWSTGSTTQTITATIANNPISVTVTDSNGCVGDTAGIIVSESSSLNPVITGNTSYCAGSNTTLDVGVYETYLWSNGDTTQIIVSTNAATYVVTVTDVNGCIGSASVVVTENPLPIPTITGNLSYCEGSNTTLSTGLFDSYIWSTSEATQTISATAGTYSVSVTDGNGCEASTSVTVTENPLPSPSITGSLTYCTGFNTTLSTATYSSYIWSEGSTTQSISATIANNPYTVTVTDANSCIGVSASVTVTESSNLNPIITGNLNYCQGSTTTLDAGTYSTYLWSNNETTQAINALAGTYSVSVTDANGCSGVSSTVTISENALPTPSITGNLSYCQGSNTTLDVDSYSSYEWSSGEFTQSISATTGSYDVSVTDANGCIGVTSVVVSENPLPAPSITGSLTYCNGNNATLSTGNYSSYLWSDGSSSQSISATTANNPIVVTVTDSKGCTGISSSVSVSVSPDLTPVISGTLSYCEGSLTTLSTGSFLTYLWSTSATTQTISAAAGIYSVSVTDVNGCSGVSSNVTVVENALPNPSITGDLNYCVDSFSVLNAGIYNSYIWSTGEISQAINASSTQYYYVTVSDASNCNGKDSVFVSAYNAFDYNSVSTPTSCNGSEDGKISISIIGTEKPYSFIWNTNPTKTDSVLVGLVSGDYIVTISDKNNCYKSDTISVTSSENACLEIPSCFTPNNDNINDTWEIKNSNLYPKITVEVYNRWGEIVFKSDGYNDAWDGTYNGKEISVSSFIYIINLNDGSEVLTGTVSIVR